MTDNSTKEHHREQFTNPASKELERLIYDWATKHTLTSAEIIAIHLKLMNQFCHALIKRERAQT